MLVVIRLFFFLSLTLSSLTWANESTLCSAVLERGNDRLFVEVVISLIEREVISRSDVEEIIEEPSLVLSLVSEEIRTLGMKEVLKLALENGIENEKVGRFLTRYLESTRKNVADGERDEVETRSAVGLSELLTSLDEIKEIYPVWVDWEGREAVTVTLSGLTDEVRILDPISSELLDSIEFPGFRDVGPVLDYIDTGSERYLLLGAWELLSKTVEKIKPNTTRVTTKGQTFLLLYDLDKKEIKHRIPVDGNPKVFHLREKGDLIYIYGFCRSRKTLHIIEIGETVKRSTVEAQEFPDRIEYLDQLKKNSFIHDGELYFLVASKQQYQLINLERSQVVVQVSFDRSLIHPVVVELKSGRLLGFMFRRDSRLCVFDPFDPGRARDLSSLEGDHTFFCHGRYPSVEVIDRRLTWLGPYGVIQVDLEDERPFKILYEKEPVGWGTRVRRFLTWWKDLTVDVGERDPIRVQSTRLSSISNGVFGPWEFEYRGLRYVVVERIKLSDRKAGLTLLNDEDGTGVGRMDFESTYWLGRLSGKIMIRDGEPFLVVIDRLLHQLRTFRLSTSGPSVF